MTVCIDSETSARGRRVLKGERSVDPDVVLSEKNSTAIESPEH